MQRLLNLTQDPLEGIRCCLLGVNKSIRSHLMTGSSVPGIMFFMQTKSLRQTVVNPSAGRVCTDPAGDGDAGFAGYTRTDSANGTALIPRL